MSVLHTAKASTEYYAYWRYKQTDTTITVSYTHLIGKTTNSVIPSLYLQGISIEDLGTLNTSSQIKDVYKRQQYYYELVALDNELDIVRQTLDTWEKLSLIHIFSKKISGFGGILS